MNRDKVDPVLYLLFAGMLVFAGILIACEHFFMADGQMFQVMAGLLTGFSGAFFGRINPTKRIPDSQQPGTTTVTATQTPPDPVTKVGDA